MVAARRTGVQPRRAINIVWVPGATGMRKRPSVPVVCSGCGSGLTVPLLVTTATTAPESGRPVKLSSTRPATKLSVTSVPRTPEYGKASGLPARSVTAWLTSTRSAPLGSAALGVKTAPVPPVAAAIDPETGPAADSTVTAPARLAAAMRSLKATDTPPPASSAPRTCGGVQSWTTSTASGAERLPSLSRATSSRWLSASGSRSTATAKAPVAPARAAAEPAPPVTCTVASASAVPERARRGAQTKAGGGVASTVAGGASRSTVVKVRVGGSASALPARSTRPAVSTRRSAVREGSAACGRTVITEPETTACAAIACPAAVSRRQEAPASGVRSGSLKVRSISAFERQGEGAARRLGGGEARRHRVAPHQLGVRPLVAQMVDDAGDQTVLPLDERHSGGAEGTARHRRGGAVDGHRQPRLLLDRAGHRDALRVQIRAVRRLLDVDRRRVAVAEHRHRVGGALAQGVESARGDVVRPFGERHAGGPGAVRELGADAVDLHAVEVWVGGGAAHHQGGAGHHRPGRRIGDGDRGRMGVEGDRALHGAGVAGGVARHHHELRLPFGERHVGGHPGGARERRGGAVDGHPFEVGVARRADHLDRARVTHRPLGRLADRHRRLGGVADHLVRAAGAVAGQVGRDQGPGALAFRQGVGAGAPLPADQGRGLAVDGQRGGAFELALQSDLRRRGQAAGDRLHGGEHRRMGVDLEVDRRLRAVLCGVGGGHREGVLPLARDRRAGGERRSVQLDVDGDRPGVGDLDDRLHRAVEPGAVGERGAALQDVDLGRLSVTALGAQRQAGGQQRRVQRDHQQEGGAVSSHSRLSSTEKRCLYGTVAGQTPVWGCAA